jgi:hypothetical protein
MKPGKNIEKRIGQTLNSLDGIRRAEPKPWLYTRIMKRLDKEEDRSIWGAISSFLARPAVAIVGLCLILVLNGFLLFNEQQDSDNLAIEQVVDSESLMASSSSFEYENLVQP